MNHFRFIVAGALLVACIIARATDGDLDPYFGIDGVTQFGPTDDTGSPALAVQRDGKIVVCDGNYHRETHYDYLIERFNADGSPDMTFGVDGSTTLAFDADSSKNICAGIAVQSDSRIVIAGARATAMLGGEYTSEFVVARIDTHGALDTTFAGGAGYTVFPPETFGYGAPNAVTVDAQDRIVVAGGAQPNADDEDFAVARLLPGGAFDTTFNGSGVETIGFFFSRSYDYATHVAIDASGRIVLAGFANFEMAVVRLLDDGTLDPTFGSGGTTTLETAPPPEGFLVDHAGRLVVAGAMAADNGSTNYDMALARLLDDGSLDTDFGDNGVASVAFDLADGDSGYDHASAIAEQSDGKLVLLGSAGNGTESSEAAAARVLADGTLDASFGVGGKVVFDFGSAASAYRGFSSVALDSGRILAAGSVQQGDAEPDVVDVLVRLQSDLVYRGTFD